MSKKARSTKITIDNLAVMVAKGFEGTATEIVAIKDEMVAGFKSVNEKLDDIEHRLGKIESNHERRLDLLEDKVQIMKTYFERNPQLKVKFG